MSEFGSVVANQTHQPRDHFNIQARTQFRYFLKRLTARITISEIHEAISGRCHLRPELSGVQLLGIGLGAIIGSGIFVLSGQAAAKYAGPAVILAFVITGVVALLAALSFSELMAIMPLAGGAYTYTYVALGEYAAWFIGWNYALLNELSALAVVVNWGDYVVDLIHTISNYNASEWAVKAPVAWNETGAEFYVTGGAINIPAIAIALALTALLLAGIRITATVNMILVIIKIIILLIFIFATCKYVNRDNYDPFIPSNQGSFSQFGVSGVMEACHVVFFAYVGFETVATVAEESERRVLVLPMATMGSLLISALIYIGVCTVMVGLVPYQLLNTNSPLSDVIKATPYGVWLYILMDIGGIAALTTVALSVFLSQTRIFYAMAHDGLLPSFLSKTYRRTAVPWISTIICGALCAIIAAFCPIDLVGETSSISALITYLFVHVEVIILRYTARDIPRPFPVPFNGKLIPVVGSILCILLMINMKKETWYRFLIWTVIGQIVYFAYGFRHSKKRQQLMPHHPSRRNSDLELVAELQRTAVSRDESVISPNRIISERLETQSEPNLHENIVENNDPIHATSSESEISNTNENNISEEFSETINAEHSARVFTIT
ncbi:unnamed protein product [Adineta ricciae]|uniref:Uncharacterized protein n=1 Tax=Adineta ricciae TaxID=249248 RepID=A0A815B733_ADIRI|nr:unnamed protein product [Adineta ricciae]